MDFIWSIDLYIQKNKDKSNAEYFAVLHRNAYKVLFCGIYYKGCFIALLLLSGGVYLLFVLLYSHILPG